MPSLRIGTWNVLNKTLLRHRILHLMADHPAEVMAFQELTPRLMATLKTRHKTVIFCPDFMEPRLRFGPKKMSFLGIASKFPFASFRIHHHKSPRRAFLGWLLGWKEMISSLSAVVETPEGRVNIINLHLPFATPAHTRLRLLAEALDAHWQPHLPNIVLGDFNTIGGSKVGQWFWWAIGLRWHERHKMEKHAIDIYMAKRGLVPVFYHPITYPFARQQLDHVYVPKKATATNSVLVHKVYGSDHRALVTTIKT